MTKWELPLEPTPSWLDPTKEVTSENFTTPQPWDGLDKTHATAAFIMACVKALLKIGLSMEQALEFTGNTISEVGWDRHFIKGSFNLGGVKLWKRDVDAYKADHGGECPKWCRAVGNKSSGDPPTCYYRVYDSLEHFFRSSVVQFVPKPGTAGEKYRYKETGEAFWGEHPSNFFPALIAAGYKGEVTKQNPSGSIAAHTQIVNKCRIILVQSLLGVEPDGTWGDVSKPALMKKAGTNIPTVAILEQLFPKE